MSFKESYSAPFEYVLIILALAVFSFAIVLWLNWQSKDLPKFVPILLPLVLLLLYAGVIVFSKHMSPGFSMLFLIAPLYYFLKTYLFQKTVRKGGLELPMNNLLIYWFVWPGIDVAPFFRRNKLDSRLKELSIPLLNIVVGLALFFIAKTFKTLWPYWVIVPLLFTALSCMLHFGIINMLAVSCKYLGFNIPMPFKSPLHAKNLADFWSGTWNSIYSVLMSKLAYKPLLLWLTRPWALLLTFLVSGIIHEIAISLPVNKGYGKPTLYFLVQVVILLLLTRFRIRNKWLNKLIFLLTVILPLPLLFHGAFVELIIMPFLSFK